MATPARRRATYEDVLAAPEHVIAEILDGELHTQPRPGGPHAFATTKLTTRIDGPFGSGIGGPGGWTILYEPELHLAGDVLVPDLAGWRNERVPELDAAFFTVAPDWICEVLSRSTAKIDRAKKLPIYAREGVRHVWLVDPSQRTLEVMRLEGGKWLLLGVHEDDAKVRAEPFDAIELELGALWTP